LSFSPTMLSSPSLPSMCAEQQHSEMSENELPSGSRLLTHLVDHYSVTCPDRVHSYVQPLGTSKSPFISITFKTLAGAVDRAAQWLKWDARVSNSTVAFLGCSDLRSAIFFLAGAKVNAIVG